MLGIAPLAGLPLAGFPAAAVPVSMSLSARGFALSSGRLEPRVLLNMAGAGFASSRGRAGMSVTLHLQAIGRASSAGQAQSLGLFLFLKGLGMTVSSGVVKFRGLGARVITFTSYWSRRNP